MNHPAAWHPDPTGRHQYRYWDGNEWTSHVADNGVAGVDQLPPQGSAEGSKESAQMRRRRTKPQFERRSVCNDGSLFVHHSIAMQAKERGEYAKTLNAALDAWDRFGLCWEVADAIFDGFLVWQKIDGFDRREAFDLAIGLYRRARSELPADLGQAPMPDRSVTPPRQAVIDWASLFNVAEWYFDAIPPDERRELAQFHFDEVLTLPPLLIADCQHWLQNLHDKYGVGDLEPLWRAQAFAFEQRDQS